jgi:NhaP-type Na+/H+ or K+/H+ antiporter
LNEALLIGLTSLLVLGIGAQWLAWRLKSPAILFLLIIGIIAGPVTHFLDPDALFGDLLFPIVSISVAIILFEGGLSLRLSELKNIGKVVSNLIFIGSLVTWIIAALGAHWLLDLDLGIAILLGGILIVTGPTVIIPLLRQVRPKGQVGSILRWEGIVIDPVGVILATLVFEGILSVSVQEATIQTVLMLLKTVFFGGFIGVAGAVIIIFLLKRFLIPDFLQNSATLMILITSFAIANHLQTESGLVTATVMGIILANQKTVTVKHIVEFKETLRVLLISSLFILLAARLKIADLDYVNINSLIYLAVLIFVARPASVFLSTIRTGLTMKERLFLACVAPRGIVAAAVASLFSLRLLEAGFAEAEAMVPLTFLVIIGTITLYSVIAAPLARALKLGQDHPQGVLFVGAHSWARKLGKCLQEEGFAVLMVDTNKRNLWASVQAGLPTHYASIMSDQILDEIKLGEMGRLLALTPNEEVNTLASIQFAQVFGRSDVYQLVAETEGKEEKISHDLRGRSLFGPKITYTTLSKTFAGNGKITKTRFTEDKTLAEFREIHGQDTLPLFIIDDNGKLNIWTANTPPRIKEGDTLLSVSA